MESINKKLKKRKQKIQMRIKKNNREEQPTSIFEASNIHYEMDGQYPYMAGFFQVKSQVSLRVFPGGRQIA